MRTITRFRSVALLTAMALSIGFFTSCQKESVNADDPTKGFSNDIQRIVPEGVINDLRSRGMVINEGKVPPNISGSFLVSPFELLSPYGLEDSYDVGEIISDYVYTFYGQNTTNKISYDYSNYNSDVGVGKGAFIAGNGSNFTIFSEDAGTSSGIPYKTVAIMSGEVTSVGIRNFQYAFVLKEKTGDTTNQKLIPINAGRIWFDGNKLATSAGSGRIGVAVRRPTSIVSATQ